MSKIKLSSIVAMAENRVIGKNNELLWRIPEDFKHFKRTTMGCPMIMGRKTFESLPGILPGRTHIIISRSAAPDSGPAPAGRNAVTPPAQHLSGKSRAVAASPGQNHPEGNLTVAPSPGQHPPEGNHPRPTPAGGVSLDLNYVKSIEKGIERGQELATRDSAKEIFIIGGGEIYKQTLPLIDRLYLTLVHQSYEGDTYFPELNWNEWNIAREERHEAEGDRPAFTFFTLDRKKPLDIV